MANNILNFVWENSTSRGTERLVLVALADQAKKENGESWPSLEKLARKVLLSRRRVCKILVKLEESGQIRIIHSNGGRHQRSHYFVRFGNRGKTVSPVTQLSEKKTVSQGTQLGEKLTGLGKETVSQGSHVTLSQGTLEQCPRVHTLKTLREPSLKPSLRIRAKSEISRGSTKSNITNSGKTEKTAAMMPQVLDPVPAVVLGVRRLPSWLPEQAWESFVEHRDKLDAPLTGYESEAIIKKLEGMHRDGHDVAEALELAIGNCWREPYVPTKRDRFDQASRFGHADLDIRAILARRI